VIFDSEEHAGEWEHVLAILEFKEPTLEEGQSQLEIYLSREPRAKYGYWTNGSQSIAVYKLPDGTVHVVKGASLPRPEDNLSKPSAQPLTYNRLKTPTERELKGVFKRLLDTVVSQDSKSTRPDEQLNAVCNLLLLKLESDSNASDSPDEPVAFQLASSEAETAKRVRKQFEDMRLLRTDVFTEAQDTELLLDDHTIQQAVYELSPLKLMDMGADAVSSAFQVFRRANLKAVEGQYFTPRRVIESAVKIMEITRQDKLIDPACGTGGFLIEAYRSVSARAQGPQAQANARTFAHKQIWGVDKDGINVKLARAMMVILGGGVGEHPRWRQPGRAPLEERLPASPATAQGRVVYGSHHQSAVRTGAQGLGRRRQAQQLHDRQRRSRRWPGAVRQPRDRADLPGARVPAASQGRQARDRAARDVLLQPQLRLAPWLAGRAPGVARRAEHPDGGLPGLLPGQDKLLHLREGLAVHRPSWFRDDKVVVSYAPTVGINKDGEELYVIDPKTGKRTNQINDQLAADVDAILNGGHSDTVRWVDADVVRETGIAVPVYYDQRTISDYEAKLKATWPDFESVSLGELIDNEELTVHGGHGSPSADMRTGTIPYIKVSDLRAGQVNINPTNRVSEVVARRYWRGPDSGLKPFDLITPARASKNIGDIAVLMPGQERVVLTKEMLVMRPGPKADFDPFYFLWAMSLKIVRQQWQRIVFTQTNREDTGQRYREIQIPMAPTRAERDEIAKPFKTYYEGTAKLREQFLAYLSRDEHHHVFLASVEAAEEEAAEELEQAAGAASDSDQVTEVETEDESVSAAEGF